MLAANKLSYAMTKRVQIHYLIRMTTSSNSHSASVLVLMQSSKHYTMLFDVQALYLH